MSLIGIAGPTCSGKTTLCQSLQCRIIESAHVSLDDFFVDKEAYPKYGGYVNMDAPEGIRFDMFKDVLERLKRGKPAEVPVYDLSASRRIGMRMIAPVKTVVCDGILLYHRPEILDLFDMRIFIDLPYGIQMERRVKRAMHHDQGYFDDVVIPMYKTHAYPTRSSSHYILDGTKGQDILLDDAFMAVKRVLG